MASAECVVLRLIAAQKARQAAQLFYRMKLVTATCQDLVRIGLMTDIPHKPVVGRVENVMHRDRKLDSAEAGTGVPAHTRTCVDNELADLVSDLLQVIDTELSKVGRRINIL
jgi:hypothetical protein